MDNVYRKPVLNANILRFLMYKYYNHLICFKKTINTYSKAKNSLQTVTQHEFRALNTNLSSFRKNSDAKIYI